MIDKNEVITNVFCRFSRPLPAYKLNKKKNPILKYISNLFKKFYVFTISIYINYLSTFITFLSFLILIFGTVFLATQKRPAFELLSALGGFIGGFATVIAITIAIKEYTLFRVFRDADKYREFIAKSIRPLKKEINDDYSYLVVILSKAYSEDDYLNNSDRKTAMDQLMSKQLDYEASIKGIVSTFAELSFHNKWIEFKFESKFQKLESILTEFKLALSKGEEYIGKYQDVNLDMKFIYTDYQEEPDELIQLLRLIDEIDTTKLI